MVLMAAVPVPGLAVRVKAPLLVSLVNLPVNSMLEEVVPMVKQTPEAVAEGEADTATIVMPVPAAAVSCASGCTRKRNKLKGERLCTTL